MWSQLPTQNKNQAIILLLKVRDCIILEHFIFPVKQFLFDQQNASSPWEEASPCSFVSVLSLGQRLLPVPQAPDYILDGLKKTNTSKDISSHV